MTFSCSPESFLFFASLLLGFLFGLYYEFFRFFRILFSHKTVLVVAEDLLFFLPISLIYIFFNYALSDGVVRYFSILGVVLGFLLYLATLGKILVHFSSYILNFLKKVLRGIFHLFFRPIINVFKNITNCLYEKYKKYRILKDRKRNAQILKRAKKHLLKKAQKGFLK
jgi:hypothetical protein